MRIIPQEVAAVIFDVDDTLLDNKRRSPERSLHERSQLQAVHSVGDAMDIDVLKNMSSDDSYEAFLTAPEHTLQSGILNMFIRAGLLESMELETLKGIVDIVASLKDDLHKAILYKDGEAFEGAVDFVQGLAIKLNLAERMAIASTSNRRDVDIFLGKVGLADLFPDPNIITIERVTKPKPDPEVFDKAFKSLKLPESDRALTYAFEDDPRGIKAAKEAGLRVVGITTRFDREYLACQPTAPDLVAESYAELSEIFGV